VSRRGAHRVAQSGGSPSPRPRAPTALAMWCAGPTLKTIFGPNFEPTFQDEASVEKAPQSGPASGTGAGH